LPKIKSVFSHDLPEVDPVMEIISFSLKNKAKWYFKEKKGGGIRIPVAGNREAKIKTDTEGRPIQSLPHMWPTHIQPSN